MSYRSHPGGGAIQALLVGVAGSLYYDFPLRASAAVVTVKTSDGDDTTTPISAVAMSHSTPDIDRTLGSAASQGDTSIVLDSTSGVREGARIIIDSDVPDISEWCIGKSWDSATKTMTLWNPLERDHDSGAKVQTTRMQLDLASGYQDQQYDSLRATITATINGAAKYFRFLYDVKYNIWTPTITVLDVLRHMTSAEQSRWSEAQGFEDKLLVGEQFLREEIGALGKSVDDFMNPRDLELAHVWATIMAIREDWATRHPDSVDSYDRAEIWFRRSCQRAVDQARWVEDGTQDLVLDEDEGTHYAMKTGLA